MSAIGLLRSGVHNSAQKKLVHHLALKCDELAVRELRALDHASKALGAPTNAAASREHHKRRLRPIPQPGRRSQRRGRSRRSPSVARCRRRSSSLVSSRSSLSPTSRNIRSTTAPRPRVISAMASTSPVSPPIKAAQIEPATTSAAADPNARTRARGGTAPRYRVDELPRGSQLPRTRVPLCMERNTLRWSRPEGSGQARRTSN
jgi:hypothetical protein